MKKYQDKYEKQVHLIARLRELSGKPPACYASQWEFFITTLQNLSEQLLELKRETLKDVCERFIAKLEREKPTEYALDELKSQLDTLVSGRDFGIVMAGLIGGKQLIKDRLNALRPLSIYAEERKTSGRDPYADRLVSETYRRLHFETLLASMPPAPDEGMVDRILTRARENVAEYCCLYQLPVSEEDTLPPFSLSRIDAVSGACFRLLSEIRKIMSVREEPRPRKL